MKRFIVLFTMMTLLLAPLAAAAQEYTLDPARTTIQFKVKFMAITNVKGVFEKFKGTVDIDETDITKSKVDVSIEAASINTGINMRDSDLRGSDFFDVVKFPTVTFVSTKVEAGTDTLKVTGDLTMKGVTKPVVLIVEDPKKLQDTQKRGASVTATVNRQDFAVGSSSFIADDVMIIINVELVK